MYLVVFKGYGWNQLLTLQPLCKIKHLGLVPNFQIAWSATFNRHQLQMKKNECFLEEEKIHQVTDALTAFGN